MAIRNISSNIDADTVSLGNCIVLMNDYVAPGSVGATPTTDMGAVKDVQLTFGNEEWIQEQGTPIVETNAWIKRQSLKIKIIGWEQTTEKLKALTCGSTSSTTVLNFGGQTAKPQFSAIFTAVNTGAESEQWEVWKMVPDGDFVKNYNLEDENLVEYNFRAQYSNRDFANASTVTNNCILARRTATPSA